MMTFTPAQMKIAGALLVVLAVAAMGLKIRNLKSDLKESQDKVTELNVKLKVQNEAVLSLKAEADAALERHKQELQVANDALEQAKEKAQVIYKTPPSQPKDLCNSALDLMNRQTYLK